MTNKQEEQKAKKFHEKKMKLKFDCIEEVRRCIKCCQKKGHIQQVAYSTYHYAITQVCFTCGVVFTSIKEKDIEIIKSGEENAN